MFRIGNMTMLAFSMRYCRAMSLPAVASRCVSSASAAAAATQSESLLSHTTLTTSRLWHYAVQQQQGRRALDLIVCEAYRSIRYYDASSASAVVGSLAELCEAPPYPHRLLLSLIPMLSECTARDLVLLFDGLSKFRISHKMVTAHMLKRFLREMSQSGVAEMDGDLRSRAQHVDTVISLLVKMIAVVQRSHSQRTLRGFLLASEPRLNAVVDAARLNQHASNTKKGCHLLTAEQRIIIPDAFCPKVLYLLEVYSNAYLPTGVDALPSYLRHCILYASHGGFSLLQLLHVFGLLWPSSTGENTTSRQANRTDSDSREFLLFMQASIAQRVVQQSGGAASQIARLSFRERVDLLRCAVACASSEHRDAHHGPHLDALNRGVTPAIFLALSKSGVLSSELRRFQSQGKEEEEEGVATPGVFRNSLCLSFLHGALSNITHSSEGKEKYALEDTSSDEPQHCGSHSGAVGSAGRRRGSCKGSSSRAAPPLPSTERGHWLVVCGLLELIDQLMVITDKSETHLADVFSHSVCALKLASSAAPQQTGTLEELDALLRALLLFQKVSGPCGCSSSRDTAALRLHSVVAVWLRELSSFVNESLHRWVGQLEGEHTWSPRNGTARKEVNKGRRVYLGGPLLSIGLTRMHRFTLDYAAHARINWQILSAMFNAQDAMQSCIPALSNYCVDSFDYLLCSLELNEGFLFGRDQSLAQANDAAQIVDILVDFCHRLGTVSDSSGGATSDNAAANPSSTVECMKRRLCASPVVSGLLSNLYNELRGVRSLPAVNTSSSSNMPAVCEVILKLLEGLYGSRCHISADLYDAGRVPGGMYPLLTPLCRTEADSLLLAYVEWHPRLRECATAVLACDNGDATQALFTRTMDSTGGLFYPPPLSDAQQFGLRDYATASHPPEALLLTSPPHLSITQAPVEGVTEILLHGARRLRSRHTDTFNQTLCEPFAPKTALDHKWQRVPINGDNGRSESLILSHMLNRLLGIEHEKTEKTTTTTTTAAMVESTCCEWLRLYYVLEGVVHIDDARENEGAWYPTVLGGRDPYVYSTCSVVSAKLLYALRYRVGQHQQQHYCTPSCSWWLLGLKITKLTARFLDATGRRRRRPPTIGSTADVYDELLPITENLRVGIVPCLIASVVGHRLADNVTAENVLQDAMLAVQSLTRFLPLSSRYRPFYTEMLQHVKDYCVMSDASSKGYAWPPCVDDWFEKPNHKETIVSRAGCSPTASLSQLYTQLLPLLGGHGSDYRGCTLFYQQLLAIQLSYRNFFDDSNKDEDCHSTQVVMRVVLTGLVHMVLLHIMHTYTFIYSADSNAGAAVHATNGRIRVQHDRILKDLLAVSVDSEGLRACECMLRKIEREINRMLVIMVRT